MKYPSHWAKATCYLSAVILAAYAPKTAHAGAIPYPNSGTVNPMTYTFTAMNTGEIDAYFVSRGGAAFSENLGMLVNGVASPAGEGLNNHTSNAGDVFDLGSVNAGDTITFFIDVTDEFGNPLGKAYSNPALNNTYDGGTGINHVYSTFAAAGQLGSSIPSGIYVGFEDLPLFDNPDYNYLDEQYVFTNVGMEGTVPDSGSTVALFGLGLAGISLFGLRKQRA